MHSIQRWHNPARSCIVDPPPSRSEPHRLPRALMSRRLSSLVLSLVFAAVGTAQQPASTATTTPRQFTAADLEGWKNIRATTVSADGKWLAYQLAPNEGDASVVVRPTGEGKEQRFPIGEPPAGGSGNPFGAAPPSPALTISGD